jgi:hypothetical protein
MTIKDFNKLHPLKVILTSDPVLHPLSAPQTANNNYYCLARDFKGLQMEIDLQALPGGVAIGQIKANQVWWVDKRTNLYRLMTYGGLYDPTTRQVTSTTPLPVDPNTPFVTNSGGTISGNLTVSGSVLGQQNIWTATTSSVTTISGYNTYLVLVNGYGGRSTVGYLTAQVNQSYFSNMSGAVDICQVNTYAATSGADYSSSQMAVFQPSGGNTTTWYTGVALTNYVTGGATGIIVGLN